ncbi:hypothetical protein [Amycolatopsis sp. H20-H5]|uniref:hypothetical protein n=1 Tax=Amycolatopsis sp. H20-H5 TaxID=3046309 RepID=UPI002DBBE670|nr:hypothetical protein [Amycolatopsis sp. H20-H5]MEC3980872.1 hypothetical protein [Amycolatopsis sp. H20-H5]
MRRVAAFRPHVLVLAASAALLAGCGGASPAPAAAPPPQAKAQAAAGPTTTSTPCGEVAGSGGAQTKVAVRGAVDCAQAKSLLTDYFAKLTPAEANSPDGPGPIALGEWTCGSGPGGDPVTSCSTEDDRQVDGVRG